MQAIQTDATVLFRLVYEAMQRAQMPVAKIFERMGIAVEQVEPLSRTKSSAQVAFWRAALEVTKDPDIGLHIGEYLPLYRGQVIEYLFLSSGSFGAGLKRVLSYQRLVTDSVLAELVHKPSDNLCYLQHTITGPKDPVAFRHFVECLLMGLLRFFKSVTEGEFKFLHVEFPYAEGASLREYRRLFGCEVTLGADCFRIHFDPAILQLKLWHAEPELLHFHEQMANLKLRELARQDLLNDVRRVVAADLESVELTLEIIASKLGIPARRLRAQLTEADTSFKQILSDYRCKLAKRLLARSNESIEQIVYLTGFSEPSTFYRAFKRWTGQTPVEYRKHHQDIYEH